MRGRSAWIGSGRCTRGRLSADATLTVENVASAGRVPLQLPAQQDAAGDLFRDLGGPIRIVGDAATNLLHSIAARSCCLARPPHCVVALAATCQPARSWSWMHDSSFVGVSVALDVT